MDNYTTLVLCGGSCKCISFCGALRYLKEYDMLNNINHIVGVSAGSLIGLFYILNYTPSEIISEVEKLNSKYIFGQELSMWSLPSNIYTLIKNLGICDGSHLRNQLCALFSRKMIPFSITFEELYEKTNIKFTVSATNLQSRQLESFNHIITPNLSVIDALQASMCIPFIFQPININGELYIDGGMKDNLPISLTDKHEHILALKLDTEENFEHNNNYYPFIQYISDIIEILFSNVWHYDNNKPNVDIINIHIPYINILNFNLTGEDIQTLVNSGYDSLQYKFNYRSKAIDIKRKKNKKHN